MPVPDSDTLSGALVALVAMLSFADLLVAPSGVNVTDTVQDAPGARLAGQLFVCANHDAAVPVTLMPFTANGTTPSFRKIALSAPLVWPTETMPKPSLVGLTSAAGTTFNLRAFVVVLALPVIIALDLVRTGFVATVNRGGPAFLDSFRGPVKWSPAVQAAAASGRDLKYT